MPGTWPSQFAGRLHGIEVSRCDVQPEAAKTPASESKTRRKRGSDFMAVGKCVKGILFEQAGRGFVPSNPGFRGSERRSFDFRDAFYAK